MFPYITTLLIATLSSLSLALLPAQHPSSETENPDPAPISINNQTTIEGLFKRSISCTFNNGVSGFCDNTSYCCWKFIAGADSPDVNGGFCCPNTQELGGGCCGNNCCPIGSYCAWADSQGHYSCIPINSTATGYPTVTSTQTTTVTQTLTQSLNVTILQTQSTTLPPTVACTTKDLSTATGALAGGIVGGLALLFIAAMLLFAGLKKGWFRRD